LPEEAVSHLDLMVRRFAPAGAIARSTWLFDDWMPDVPEKTRDDSDPEEVINSARLNAVREVVQESGTSGLIELAGKVKLPRHVAYAARGLELDFDELCHFFGETLRAGRKWDVIAGLILAEGVLRFGGRWKAAAADMLALERATAERVAELLMALDESTATWDYVRAYGDEVNDTYWQRKHSYFVEGEADELMFAVDNYLAHKRPLAALDSASHRMSDLPTSLLIRLLDESAQETNVDGLSVGTISLHNIEKAFDELRKREDVTPDDIAALEFRYLPVFRARKKPLVLHTLMVKQPSLFMDAICAVFKPASRESGPPAAGAVKLAVAAYELITGIRMLPGQVGNAVDEQALVAWCTEVRRIAVEVDRVKITDQRIGAVFAHAPLSGRDNAWPHEAVRSAIEQLGSDELERGVAIERVNMRGVYSKAIGEGGDQERALARQSREWADAMPEYPRTAAMLMRISEGWLRDAEQADLSAQKEELRW
jgi:hypothetical protein